MEEFINQRPDVYKLPPIKALHFLPIHYRNQERCTEFSRNDTIEIESLFNFTSYKYRLPDIVGYKAFVVCNGHGWEDYNKKMMNNSYCNEFAHLKYGYLLLYNTTSQIVSIIELLAWSSSGNGDGQSFSGRTFDIDKSFNITLKDYYLNVDWDKEDEYGNPLAEYEVSNIYKVAMLEDGNIKVEFPSINRPYYDDETGEYHNI